MPLKPALVAVTVNEAMSDTPPDHLAINPASPFHDAQALERAIAAHRDEGRWTWTRAEPSLEDVFIDLMSRSRDNFK